MSAGTILVVDDSPETLGMVAAVLEPCGHTVLVALGGARALAIVEEAPPDLVLLDAMMPELDGFETLRRLRRCPGAALLPVIFLTGLSDTESVVRALGGGAVDFLTKPVVPRELVARVAVHLAGARLAASTRAAIELAGEALFAVDAEGGCRWATPTAERLLAEAALLADGRAAPALAGLLAGAGDAPVLAAIEGTGEGARRIEVVRIGALEGGEHLLRIASVQPTSDEARLKAALGVTRREAEVLLWLARGKTNRDIADILGLSPRTVNKHLEGIYAKLGVENRAAAVVQTLSALPPRRGP